RMPLLRCPISDYYCRQEKNGLLLGFYEQDCKTWGMDGIDPKFSNDLCPDDLDRVMDVMEGAFARMPALMEVGINSEVCFWLFSSYFDLGEGDTLNIYIQGHTCEDNNGIYTFTSDDEQAGAFVWYGGFSLEFITDAEDQGGGWEVYLIPLDGFCEFPGLTPEITNPLGAPISNCWVQFTNLVSPDSCLIQGGGCYVPLWGNQLDYSEPIGVIPQSPEDYANGLTTLDLVAIKKHVLGVELLESPYQWIAADANNSESITTLDLVEIQKVILGVQEGFPNNTSWRFPFICDVEANGWTDFRESLPIEGWPNPLPYPRFYAVKVGDVNFSANLEF
ncbi:MAG: hypothetical protein AAFU60_12705, partial [Bacteroidota bacterium]